MMPLACTSETVFGRRTKAKYSELEMKGCQREGHSEAIVLWRKKKNG